MSLPFSLYLDLVRFVAACLVLVFHSNSRLIVESVLPLSSYGHGAVIVFFVLSGYVIAYVTDAKEKTAREYWASRLSRVWSLAIPAVLLTPILDSIGQSMAPVLYAGHTTQDYTALRIVTSLAFLNEIWSLSIMSFSNIAYWSLNYEVWYYLFFGLFTFADPRRRWLWIMLACLLAGPKILLLAPIWCLGVVIYRWQRPQSMSEWQGWLCVAASVVLALGFDHGQVAERVSAQLKALIGAHWHRELAYSDEFLSDYLLAGIVFLNFVGMRRVVFRLEGLLRRIERPVRVASGYTFSIYILNQPLLYFFAALIDLPPQGYGKYALVMAATLVSIVLIGSVTERRRFALRRLLLAGFDRLRQVRPFAGRRAA